MHKCTLCNHCENNVCCIDKVPIFASLSGEEKMDIAEVASTLSFEKGETIYKAGDEGNTLFVLDKGLVKIFRLSASGKEQVLRIVQPGEFMGELSLFSSLPLTDYAQALEKTIMCALQGERIKELMAKHPSIAFKVIDELSRRLEKAENRIEDISLSSVSSRVAGALLEFSKNMREFSLPMAKGDLASQLGMTKETLSRKLAALQEQNLIELIGQRKIIIINREKLEEISLDE